ncbi:MAG: DNA ligase D [Cereibacter sphaeroides]|uniref:DNA ligase (ATP) n=1 Tax=Cereibacter sphaeroides TaxID=1063 RepID=A0A2W5SD51_CERSP|nr:MAG: DNA ligase D [Cereibacter sphaeroides]
MDLKQYHARRRFGETPEPKGAVRKAKTGQPLSFVVQKHDATRLHFDFRLEWQGVLLSWAVTRGPSADPAQKRLAVRTEDHPIDYGDFEGIIAPGNYGAGSVMLWDRGTWIPMDDPEQGLIDGKLKFTLFGERMKGGWTLVRMKGHRDGDARRENWLLIKERDDAAEDDPDGLVDRFTTSIATTRKMKDIAAGHETPPQKPKAKIRTTPMPGFVEPQLATLSETPPDGEDWWHEAKLDGYRGQMAVAAGQARIYSRSGLDWSDRFARLVPFAKGLPCRSALIDGEVIAPEGGFGGLQSALKTGTALFYVAFDLLHLDGKDLRGKPLRARRQALEKLFSGQPTGSPLRLSPVVEGKGELVLQNLCAASGEGVVSKRADAPYRSGRGGDWVKVKCERRAEFVVIGFQPSDKAGRPFASLLLASLEGSELVYRGKVGTGFDDKSFEDLAARMAPLKVTEKPLDVPAAETKGARWLRPQLVAEVRYAEFTTDGRIRHGVYIGLREDKPAMQVQAEGTQGKLVLRGIAVSHPERVVFTSPDVTKGEVARYYDHVAERMLPHLKSRVVSLLRFPEGITEEGFFQKHKGAGFPDAIATVAEDDAEVMHIESAAGLVAAVQMGTIEFHIRNARLDKPDLPDRLVLDLDPDPSVGFAEVRSAAADIRDRLAELGLASHPMVTGGKGVHVIVPLRRSAGMETVELFAKTFAKVAVEAEPERFTAALSKRARTSRIFIDWLRNQRESTAVCPWSLRGRPGASVAMLVTWEELARLSSANSFTLTAALARKEPPAPKPTAITAATVERLSRMAG